VETTEFVMPDDADERPAAPKTKVRGYE
jgi:multicomponent Na+:H+ antiporter subunit C